MPDYSKSVIYKIYDNTNRDVYFGSTCNELRFRISKHKTDAKNNIKCKSQSIILNGDYTYSVVEKYPCDTKLELHTRERWWIENNVCLNKYVPSRTKKEYYADNANEIKERHKQYYIENKDKINKMWNEKFTCECGGKFTLNNKTHHLKTNKHQDYIKSQTDTHINPTPHLDSQSIP